MGWVGGGGGGGGGGNFSHAINQLTHDFSCNMRFIFLDFYFPFYLALPLHGKYKSRKINPILHSKSCVNQYLFSRAKNIRRGRRPS